MSNTFCPLPWIHLATRPDGDIRLCCTSNASGAGTLDNKVAGLITKDGNRMNLREHTVEEVWNSEFMKETRLQMLNGEIPSSCTKCFNEENLGIKSKRNWETEVWKQRIDLDSIIARTGDDGSLPVSIPYFDLRLGNLCNLKCVMCSPHDSSSWIKDWKIQFPKYKSNMLIDDQGWDQKTDYTWYQKSSFLTSMKDQARYIKELYFAGGEPLLIPEHYNILRFMVDEGFSTECSLRYNSNGTTITEELLELWNKFKSVKFNFSIDAVGKKNDYIRYPSSWDDLVQNLKFLDETPNHITVNIACAVQALNICYLDELVEWKLAQNFRKINPPEYGAGLIGLHLVYLPSYLNIRTLPASAKRLASDRISSLVNKLSCNKFDADPYGKQRWLGLIDYMYKEDWSHKLPAMVEYLEVTDNTRGTNFRSIFPELDVKA